MSSMRARHAPSNTRLPLLAVALAALLAGCQVAPPPATDPQATRKSEPFRNVYTQDKDSAPRERRDIDYHAIPDAVPKVEPRGKYGNKSPYVVLGRTYEVLPEARGYREEGGASWYGEKFQGFMTSSMEPYDMYAMTAAHKSLPIPSYVRVTNLENGRSVVVRVNDRGPFHEGRIIDLSWAAAQKLGYANVGTARVRVEAIDPQAPAEGDGRYFVQLGAFSRADSAQALVAQARGATRDPVSVASGEDALHRVRIGPYADRASAERARDTLRAGGLGAGTLVPAP